LLGLIRWRIDPDGGRFAWWCGLLSDETLRMLCERPIERHLTGGMDLVRLPVVNLVGRHQSQAGVMMGVIVPSEKGTAKLFGIFDAAETSWEAGLVFQSFKVALRVTLRREPPGREPIATLRSSFRWRLRCVDGWRGGDHHRA
jgi:hypothetical protein